LSIQKIATYLKKNPSIYLNIEGHCDERASAAYNMALGLRRANHVRVLLIKQGIDFNRIYTVSHGKEKPKSLGHAEEALSQNRRAEFKIYKR
jgi:peptidoglycan-associated lipoprotein